MKPTNTKDQPLQDRALALVAALRALGSGGPWAEVHQLNEDLKTTVEVDHPKFLLLGERPVIFVPADAEACRNLTEGSRFAQAIDLLYLPLGYQFIGASEPLRARACGRHWSLRGLVRSSAAALLYLKFLASDVYKLYSYREAYGVKRAASTYSPELSSELMPAEQKAFDLLGLPKDAAILDVGCGGGRTTYALIRNGYSNVQAFDSEPKFIEEAQKAEDGRHADRFRVLDVLDLDRAYDGQLFDVVFFSFNGLDFLYPYNLRDRATRNLVGKLKRGGRFVFCADNTLCVNRHTLILWLKNFWGVLLMRRYFLSDVSFGKLMKYFGTPAQIRREMEHHGLVQEHVVPNVPRLFPFRDPFPYYVFKKI